MRFMLGIKVGGTFTDFVAYDREARQLSVGKNASVPGNTGEGILSGLSSFSHRDEVANIWLGTTVAANALLEPKGPTAGYLTTKGFRDVVIRRGNHKYHIKPMVNEQLQQTEMALRRRWRDRACGRYRVQWRRDEIGGGGQ